jgi:F-type H+-transporting ATPase subunit epsilon
MPTFELEIVTPEKTVYTGTVESFRAPGTTGGFGVLPRHHPMLASLTVGHFLVREPGEAPIRFSTSGGFVEVQRDRVTVLAETAIPADQIDVARAEAARDRAAERLKRRREEDVDVARAEAALARAINRLRAVSAE